jgi:hypothetical protein
MLSAMTIQRLDHVSVVHPVLTGHVEAGGHQLWPPARTAPVAGLGYLV